MTSLPEKQLVSNQPPAQGPVAIDPNGRWCKMADDVLAGHQLTVDEGLAILLLATANCWRSWRPPIECGIAAGETAYT